MIISMTSMSVLSSITVWTEIRPTKTLGINILKTTMSRSQTMGHVVQTSKWLVSPTIVTTTPIQSLSASRATFLSLDISTLFALRAESTSVPRKTPRSYVVHTLASSRILDLIIKETLTPLGTKSSSVQIPTMKPMKTKTPLTFLTSLIDGLTTIVTILWSSLSIMRSGFGSSRLTRPTTVILTFPKTSTFSSIISITRLGLVLITQVS